MHHKATVHQQFPQQLIEQQLHLQEKKMKLTYQGWEEPRRCWERGVLGQGGRLMHATEQASVGEWWSVRGEVSMQNCGGEGQRRSTQLVGTHSHHDHTWLCYKRYDHKDEARMLLFIVSITKMHLDQHFKGHLFAFQCGSSTFIIAIKCRKMQTYIYHVLCFRIQSPCGSKCLCFKSIKSRIRPWEPKQGLHTNFHFNRQRYSWNISKLTRLMLNEN